MVILFQQNKICLESAELVCISFLVCVVLFEENASTLMVRWRLSVTMNQGRLCDLAIVFVEIFILYHFTLRFFIFEESFCERILMKIFLPNKYPAGKITRILWGIPGDGEYLEGNPSGNLGCK